MWLGGALLAMAALGVKAQAAGVGNPSYLNIDVTITASKSVAVNTVQSSSDTSTTWNGTPNLAVNPTSTATVKNDSGILSETWSLSTNASSLSPSGTTWARQNSTTTVGADQFAVQAVFGSSNTTTCAAASWTNGTIAPPLTTGAGTLYTGGGALADTALVNNGTSSPDNVSTMYAFNAATGAGLRALCWRLILPSSTAAPNNAVENIQVIVTAN